MFELRLQLEKVLQQGDIGDCAEPYMREDKVHTPHASHSRHLFYVHMYMYIHVLKADKRQMIQTEENDAK